MDSQKRNKIGKAGIGYTIGNYLIRGLGFLTIPIFARLLSTADYGVYNTYSAYESIMFIFVGLALHTSFKNARLKFGDRFESYISSCIFLIIINTICFLVLGNVLCFFFVLSNYIYLIILVLHSFSTAIIGYYNSYLSIFYRSRSYVQLSLFNAIANILVSIILILTFFKGNRGYGRIVGTFLPCFVIAVMLVGYFWKKSRPIYSKEYWKYALTYSLPLIPHGISQVLLSSFDRIMIANMVGSSEAGIYSFSYNVYAIISVTYGSLDQVWSPWFYEKMSSGETNGIKKCAAKYAFGMGLLTVGIMFVSPEIVYFLGTKDYYEAIYLLVPTILGGFFSFLYTFPAIIEYYHEKTKYIALGTMGAAVINIILNYIFIKEYGYAAAAYTTLVTYALYFMFHYFLSIHINRGSLYELKHFIVIILFVVFCGMLVQFLIPYMWIRWILGVIVGIILLFFLYRQFDFMSLKRNRGRRKGWKIEKKGK